ITPGSEYRVQSGDSISAILMRAGVERQALWPTIDAVVAANPNAFVDGNPDKLMAGTVLVLPVVTPATAASSTNVPTSNVTTLQTPEIEAVDGPDVPPPAAGATIAERTNVLESIARSDAELARVQSEIARLRQELAEQPETRQQVASDSPFLQSPTTVTKTVVVETPTPVADTAPVETTVSETRESGWSFAAKLVGLFGSAFLILIAAILWRMRSQSKQLRAKRAAAQRPVREVATVTSAVAQSAEQRTRQSQYFVNEERRNDNDKGVELDYEFGETIARDDELAIDFDVSSTQAAPVVTTETTESLPSEDNWLIENTDRFEFPRVGQTTDSMEATLVGDTVEQTAIDEQDMDLLQKDYETEFTKTQQLERELAEAALASGLDGMDAVARRAGEPVDLEPTVEQPVAEASIGDTTQSMPPEELLNDASRAADAYDDLSETMADEDATAQITLNSRAADLDIDLTSTLQTDIDDIADIDDDDDRTAVIPKTGKAG
ncbi:MAG: hypothetical protein AAAFM81_15330, partial [Pseudomonadota bacterium]